MSWLASLVNWAWERGFAWPKVRCGVALYASLLALVLLFGGARLALSPAQASTVRVAGITASRALFAVSDQQMAQLSPHIWEAIASGKSTPADREIVRQMFAPDNNELFSRSEQEARAGAKIILWPECGARVLQEDEAALIARASALARTTGTYLDMGVGVLQKRVWGLRPTVSEHEDQECLPSGFSDYAMAFSGTSRGLCTHKYCSTPICANSTLFHRGKAPSA